MSITGIQAAPDTILGPTTKNIRRNDAPGLPPDPNPSGGAVDPRKVIDPSQQVTLPGEADPQRLLYPEGFGNAQAAQDLDYDLSGNGVVNIDDLLALLNQITAPADEAVDEPSPSVGQPARSQTPVIRAATDIPAADVNVTPTRTDASEVADDVVTEVVTTTPTNEAAERTTLSGDVTESAAGGATADDVSVNPSVQDISRAIFGRLVDAGFISAPESLGAFFTLGGIDEGVATDVASNLSAYFGEQNDEFANKQARLAAKGLVQRLQNEGFINQPPENIHALAAELAGTQGSPDDIIRNVQTYYPNGLGLNLQG